MIPKYIPKELSCLETTLHMNRPLPCQAIDFHTEPLRGHFTGPEGPSSQIPFDWFPKGKAFTFPETSFLRALHTGSEGKPSDGLAKATQGWLAFSFPRIHRIKNSIERGKTELPSCSWNRKPEALAETTQNPAYPFPIQNMAFQCWYNTGRTRLTEKNIPFGKSKISANMMPSFPPGISLSNFTKMIKKKIRNEVIPSLGQRSESLQREGQRKAALKVKPLPRNPSSI